MYWLFDRLRGAGSEVAAAPQGLGRLTNNRLAAGRGSSSNTFPNSRLGVVYLAVLDCEFS